MNSLELESNKSKKLSCDIEVVHPFFVYNFSCELAEIQSQNTSIVTPNA
jgi:hypothetical protein